eukprot:Nk52_evm14s164 gene=Nk52_evmTU14s164
MTAKIAAPCGVWKSPLKAETLFKDSVSWQFIMVDEANGGADGKVYWVEGRPSEKGRSVVCSLDADGTQHEWTIKDHNCRTLVHEYGGKCTYVYDGCVYYSNALDQRIYKQDAYDKAPVAISPDTTKFRFADFVVDGRRQKIYSVLEDHTNVGEHSQYPVNTLASLDIKSGKVTNLAEGSDFYIQPRLSPDGKQLAFVEWNFPNMPWNITSLWKGILNEDGSGFIDGSLTKVAGNGSEAAGYPTWSPNNVLFYITDRDEWWNIYCEGMEKSIHPKNAEFCVPLWRPSQSMFTFDINSGDLIAMYKDDVKWSLIRISVPDFRATNIECDFDDIVSIIFSASGCLYSICGGAKMSRRIVSLDAVSGKHSVLKVNSGKDFSGYLSEPQFVEFPTTNGHVAYGYFYPPCNKDYCALPGELPPLLVKAHGGPTGYCLNTLNMQIQYFTSRGFGVFDVNYRGSCGFGRTFRDLLYTNWGVYDVEDCCLGAEYLARQGKVDNARLVIDGSSAGGYTTLASLAFKDTFKAGASIYGIGDLKVLNGDTHKFESRYCSLLLTDDAESPIFKDRSPINHVDNLSCPLVIFQGEDDKVVPPNQAHMMYDAVNKKNLPVALQMFEGEAHGWRKKETMISCVEGELYFFLKVFGLKPDEPLFKVDIKNL